MWRTQLLTAVISSTTAADPSFKCDARNPDRRHEMAKRPHTRKLHGECAIPCLGASSSDERETPFQILPSSLRSPLGHVGRHRRPTKLVAGDCGGSKSKEDEYCAQHDPATTDSTLSKSSLSLTSSLSLFLSLSQEETTIGPLVVHTMPPSMSLLVRGSLGPMPLHIGCMHISETRLRGSLRSLPAHGV